MELVEALQGTPAESFVKMVKLNLQDIKNSFFEIGFRLNEANMLGYYKELGFASIEELAESEFGFKRSTTYNLIGIFRRFSVYGYETGYVYKNQIRDECKDYTYSQLVEINRLKYLPFRRSLNENIPIDSSVRDIIGYVKYANSFRGSISRTLPEWKQMNDVFEMKIQPIKEVVQTFGQIEGQVSMEEVLEPVPEEIVASAPEKKAEIVFSSFEAPKGKLSLKNKKEREEWLENYKDWGVWLKVPQVSKTFYRYNFVNGCAFIVEECLEYWSFSSVLESKVCHRYAVIDDDHPEYAYGVIGRVSAAVEWLTKHAKEI